MKQIIQNLKNGTTELVEAPAPVVKPGHLLIANRASVISVGTEKMLVEFGRSGYLAKARQQPDKVKQVIEKIKTDGLLTTYDAVKGKLEELKTLGNCSAGVVVAVGAGVEGFSVGDRVASNGPHAEVVQVPKNLVEKVPKTVTDEEAAFTVPGAIAMQGVRLAEPTIGERFVVFGAGLIGLLTVQILLAGGCRVLALDYNKKRLELAESFGAEISQLTDDNDPLQSALSFSGGRGVDGVILATATGSSKPLQQAAEICRKRGRIILIGTADLKLYREEFYKKELTFQVSCSYGPGRYDPNYEEKGQDYPFGYVRWTEQRNMEAVLELIRVGKLDVHSLITHRFPFEKALDAYDMILKGKEAYLGVVLQYAGDTELPGKVKIELGKQGAVKKQAPAAGQSDAKDRVIASDATGEAAVGMIGAGEFSGRVLLPALKDSGAKLNTIAASGGVSAALQGRKFGFEAAASDAAEIYNDQSINTVFITTRHDSHGRYVLESLKAGKNVFVEKPLCLTLSELEEISGFYQGLLVEIAEGKRPANNPSPLLMVGFNRRFSPYTLKMKALSDAVKSPKSMVMTINAGQIPEDHWTQDVEVGGGRIIGEACHFIDLLRFLAGSRVKDYSAFALDDQAGAGRVKDSVVISLAFENGSIGSINYLSRGHKTYPKEKLELFCGGRILALDNFRKLSGYGWPGFKKQQSFRQQKGHKEEVEAFIAAVRAGGPAPIPFDQIEEVSRLSILIDQQVRGRSS